MLHFANGSTLDALPANDGLRTARDEPEKPVSTLGGIRRVPAGGRLANGCAFLPPGTDLRPLQEVSVDVSEHRRCTVRGACLSVEQKDELIGVAAAEQR